MNKNKGLFWWISIIKKLSIVEFIDDYKEQRMIDKDFNNDSLE